MSDDPTDVTIASYDANVDRYVATAPGQVTDQVAALLRELAARVPGGRVLELGSGPGREADYLEQLGVHVDRTDATAAFVDALRARGHDARLLDARGDLGGPYDAIFANAVLLHLDRDDLETVARSCYDAVRPGGLIAATFKEGDGEAWSEAKLEAPRWFVYWREQPLRELFERAGWQVERIDHIAGRTEPWLHPVCRRET